VTCNLIILLKVFAGLHFGKCSPQWVSWYNKQYGMRRSSRAPAQCDLTTAGLSVFYSLLQMFLRITTTVRLHWEQTGDPWGWYNVADDMTKPEAELRGILTGVWRNKNTGRVVIVRWSIQFFLLVYNTCYRGELPSPLQLCGRDCWRNRLTQMCLYVSHPVLTFQSLAVTLHTTRFNIKKFYVVPTLRLCVLCGSQNKQQFLPYKTLRDRFL
jgi:hypothetical protein